MRLAVVAVDQHVAAVDAAEPAAKKSLAVDPLAHHDLREPAGEPPIVVGAAQRPIQPRRRDFERVSGRDDVLDVENRTQVAADVRAILDADAVLCRGGRAGAVDLDPQHHARRFAPELDVENLQPAVGGDPASDLPHLFDDRFRGHKLKKWAHAHFGPTSRLRTQNYITKILLPTDEVWTIVAAKQSSRRPSGSRPRNEAVAVRPDDLDVEEIAGAVGRRVAFAQEYRRVDVRRLRFETRLQDEVVLARRAVHDHP